MSWDKKCGNFLKIPRIQPYKQAVPLKNALWQSFQNRNVQVFFVLFNNAALSAKLVSDK